MERYDVAVVGGGPAGTSAAWEAAKRGAEAVALEKGVPREDRDRLGPDSTDAAGILDYWVDIMDIDYDRISDDVIHRQLDGTDFIGPSEEFAMDTTGIDSSYPNFGFTFHRARFDDWLRDEAESSGAEYRVGVSVVDVETDRGDDPRHVVELRNGDEIGADVLILADGPQRQMTNRVLDRYLPAEESITDYLGTTHANHIAYQEYREIPQELFDESRLKFWWGYIPGETAYPWVFPNDGTVARVGLTMPIGLGIDDVENPTDYVLVDEDDEQLPSPGEYLRRLLEHEYGDEYDVDEDFPIVEDRGKQNGTETYPISSTRPIDSPTEAGILVAGGAMGTTSAFHEGGDHVAIRTGKIAGELAADGDLRAYNDRWKAAIGAEITRNVTFADIVEDYGPADWDRTFSVASDLTAPEEGKLIDWELRSGFSAMKLLSTYKRTKFSYRNGKYVQFHESKYEI
ncbi:NAD(P)/FAD-dependent oxidoreductase [Natranaeroarchaeum sulfidigenes]|uniref:Dehydrogenase (Flavoprotein) n=1 Tax=Natranaeroarchaeum sulfidigenes TaxID=2784880 RepID=A0A897MUG5_9EURY|nr:NAD(P)/FAD-dependent oxidoreductase [Natranaeroarchaeum sulfidigenes]QSG02683.1 Dehydrogenase (flavoprotein) [Natranaeroarchaeum sulfidigenes]